jgi:hypothetical protein
MQLDLDLFLKDTWNTMRNTNKNKYLSVIYLSLIYDMLA